MRFRERLEWVVRVATIRPAVTVGIALTLALAGGIVALGLSPSAATSTFVSSSDPTYKATADQQRHFGSDAVVILIHESLPNLVETKDLATVSQLEACLAGQSLVANETLGAFVPAAASAQRPYGGAHSACARLMAARPVQAVYGPGTFLNRAVSAVNSEVQTLKTSAQQAINHAGQTAYELSLARHQSPAQALAAGNAAAQLEQQQQADKLAQMALQSGITSNPRIDDQNFISQVVFDQTRGVNQPKARFSYLFPTTNSALIQVRLKSSLTQSQQAQAIGWIRQAVAMPMFRSAYDATYTVTGEPVVVNDLASSLTGSIEGLLIAVVIVMAVTLLIVFRSRLRLLPLAVALAASGITFGLIGLLGVPLTMASIAVLPVLVGLSVDYAIQFQSRVQEAWASGQVSGREAVLAGARSGAPTIATAAVATATGFLVLLLSPVPMVRSFGLLLVLGIAVALACALTAGAASIALGLRPSAPGPSMLRPRAGGEHGGGALSASLRGAGEILGSAARRAAAPVGRGFAAGRGRITPPRIELARLTASPQRVLIVAVVLALLGWVADTQTSVQSDVTKLVPSSMPALKHLRTLERLTGVSGELDVTVRANNVATPKTIGWMIDYEQQLLTHYGYLETKGCSQATLCPALSLPDLFSAGSTSGQPGAGLTAASINGLLNAVPPYFSQAVVTSDRREATLAFGIRLMPLSRQQKVIDYMRSQLHPPRGVTARLAGLPVLAAQADSVLSSSVRRLLTLLAGLAAVFVVLLLVLGQVRRAVVPLIPIALATGWSALIVWLIGIPLNPMSATLGTLVIAISTEFSVLLSERFRQERAAGHEPRQALALTYQRTGKAVLASGITAIAGFAVLIVSDITMLRDFGFVTLIDLTVSLAGVLVILPSVLALSERDDLAERAREVVRRGGDALRARRRRARMA
jgi:hydrophobe/amphiphile efflux-3 (HAE3) family protein